MARLKLLYMLAFVFSVGLIDSASSSPAPSGKSETKIRIHVPVKHHTHYHTRTKTVIKEVKKTHPHESDIDDVPHKFKHISGSGPSGSSGPSGGGGSGYGGGHVERDVYPSPKQYQNQQKQRVGDLFGDEEDFGFSSDEYVDLYPKQKTKKIRKPKNPYY